jgi:hypothetical protein
MDANKIYEVMVKWFRDHVERDTSTSYFSTEGGEETIDGHYDLHELAAEITKVCDGR